MLLLPVFLFLFTAPCVVAMQKPALPDLKVAVDITRYGSIKDFKALLNQLSPEEACNIRLSCKSNLLHVLAYPLSYDEWYEYNTARVKIHGHLDLARIHAIKADILLRKCGSVLFEKNNGGDTPATIAASTGWLPVLARIMLNHPTDWPFFVYKLNTPSTLRIVTDFLEMMHVRHMYPTISLDLHTELPRKEIVALYQWAEKTQEELVVEKSTKCHLAQLTAKQLTYLLEGYLTNDIYQQYRMHPDHETVKAVFHKDSN
jgi:hypothetical protein